MTEFWENLVKLQIKVSEYRIGQTEYAAELQYSFIDKLHIPHICIIAFVKEIYYDNVWFLPLPVATADPLFKLRCIGEHIVIDNQRTKFNIKALCRLVRCKQNLNILIVSETLHYRIISAVCPAVNKGVISLIGKQRGKEFQRS